MALKQDPNSSLSVVQTWVWQSSKLEFGNRPNWAHFFLFSRLTITNAPNPKGVEYECNLGMEGKGAPTPKGLNMTWGWKGRGLQPQRGKAGK